MKMHWLHDRIIEIKPAKQRCNKQTLSSVVVMVSCLIKMENEIMNSFTCLPPPHLSLPSLSNKSFSQTHQMSWEFCTKAICVCGHCTTAKMIFNCFPGIVSMLGTCIVFC